MVRNRPHLFFCIRGSVSWAKYTVLISSWSVHKRQSSTVVALNNLDGGPPVLVTQISTRPKRFSTSATNRGACANGNFRTFAGQFLRRRASQPFARRSHNRHASAQPQVHPSLQVQSFMFSRRAQTRQISFTPLDAAQNEQGCEIILHGNSTDFT